jgi:hypothetical protein
MKYLIIFFSFVFLPAAIYPQMIEGDGLLNITGTEANNPGTKKFFEEYGIKKSQEGKYSSDKFGIDIGTSHDTLTSVTMYQTSEMYGTYTGKLPKGLRFGMSNPDIVKILGKPSLAYINTGYMEYTYGRKVMACWFENKALNQVLITLK